MVLTWNLSDKRTPRHPTSYAKESKSNSASYITPHGLSATPRTHSFLGNRYEESGLPGGSIIERLKSKMNDPLPGVVFGEALSRDLRCRGWGDERV